MMLDAWIIEYEVWAHASNVYFVAIFPIVCPGHIDGGAIRFVPFAHANLRIGCRAAHSLSVLGARAHSRTRKQRGKQFPTTWTKLFKRFGQRRQTKKLLRFVSGSYSNGSMLNEHTWRDIRLVGLVALLCGRRPLIVTRVAGLNLFHFLQLYLRSMEVGIKEESRMGEGQITK